MGNIGGFSIHTECMGNIGGFSIHTDIVKIDCSCKVEHHKVPGED